MVVQRREDLRIHNSVLVVPRDLEAPLLVLPGLKVVAERRQLHLELLLRPLDRHTTARSPQPVAECVCELHHSRPLVTVAQLGLQRHGRVGRNPAELPGAGHRPDDREHTPHATTHVERCRNGFPHGVRELAELDHAGHVMEGVHPIRGAAIVEHLRHGAHLHCHPEGVLRTEAHLVEGQVFQRVPMQVGRAEALTLHRHHGPLHHWRAGVLRPLCAGRLVPVRVQRELGLELAARYHPRVGRRVRPVQERLASGVRRHDLGEGDLGARIEGVVVEVGQRHLHLLQARHGCRCAQLEVRLEGDGASHSARRPTVRLASDVRHVGGHVEGELRLVLGRNGQVASGAEPHLERTVVLGRERPRRHLGLCGPPPGAPPEEVHAPEPRDACRPLHMELDSRASQRNPVEVLRDALHDHLVTKAHLLRSRRQLHVELWPLVLLNADGSLPAEGVGPQDEHARQPTSWECEHAVH